MRILITGANGYIGSKLVSYFNNLKNPSIDLLLLGDEVNLEDFKNVVLELIKLKPEIIIHCAGASSVGNSFENPYMDFQKNVLTTRNLLETMRIYFPNTHLIYLSSAAVYGDTTDMPIKESNHFNPISPYGYSKVCSEYLIQQYRELYNVQSTVLRIFSVYGNGMQKQVVYDIFKKFYDKNSNEVVLFGTGEETRDFIHIQDLGRVVKLIINSNLLGVFNVASGKSISIKQLAELIKEVIQSEKEIKFIGESRTGDPLKWTVDISKLVHYGFKSTKNMEEGLKEYNEWFKGEIN